MQRELKNYGLYGLAHLGFIVKFILKIYIDLVSSKQLFTNCSFINQQLNSQTINNLRQFVGCLLVATLPYTKIQSNLIYQLSQIFLDQLASETEYQFNIQNSMPFYGHPDFMLEYN
ncbi:Hypothetical_protein [Hexamita inflata]|uniref:Hypothetical_protein n=1 Tax=Hexamita inflata TaxID=28002 RepID=A0AA86QW07_9EUKA|nr:Hypothetical protein HINF_LOCUS54726 [Hexamita inflata]